MHSQFDVLDMVHGNEIKMHPSASKAIRQQETGAQWLAQTLADRSEN